MTSFQSTMSSGTSFGVQGRVEHWVTYSKKKGGSGIYYFTRLFENQTHLTGVNYLPAPTHTNPLPTVYVGRDDPAMLMMVHPQGILQPSPFLKNTLK